MCLVAQPAGSVEGSILAFVTPCRVGRGIALVQLSNQRVQHQMVLRHKDAPIANQYHAPLVLVQHLLRLLVAGWLVGGGLLGAG